MSLLTHYSSASHRANMAQRAVELTEQLIAQPSVTPDDAGCQTLMHEILEPLGFDCHTLPFGAGDETVQNLFATRFPTAESTLPTVIFAGHTDVVPTGPVEQWQFPPFTPTHADGKLYGRGASDMKASLAAMLVATEAFCRAVEKPAINVGFLITSDEEGPAQYGTTKVCDWLKERGTRLNYCVVGEPTAVHRTGDMIKNGRRGSMSGRLRVIGKQGHIAYPQLASNPIHLLAPAMQALVAHHWDDGNDYFPPTSWQVSNIHAGTGASNVIPGEVVVDFNFRFSSEWQPKDLQTATEAVIKQHLTPEQFDLQWHISGHPFLTPQGTLVGAAQHAIQTVTNQETQLSTTGGTSDGRFIAHVCDEVIELGPPNATIHQINENIVVADLEPLPAIYLELLLWLHKQSLKKT